MLYRARNKEMLKTKDVTNSYHAGVSCWHVTAVTVHVYAVIPDGFRDISATAYLVTMLNTRNNLYAMVPTCQFKHYKCRTPHDSA
jgi:hypothetical protein